jgi:hypothetical protein
VTASKPRVTVGLFSSTEKKKADRKCTLGTVQTCTKPCAGVV